MGIILPDAKEDLKKINRLSYAIAALITVGVLLIVYGASEGITGCWIAGLVIVFVFALYGIPLVWLRNSERRKTLRIAVFIKEHEANTIEMVSGSMGISDDAAWDKVRWLLEHGYLPGYVINGNRIVLSKLIDPEQQEHSAVCPNCGASFRYVGRIGQCPYCGDHYPPNTRERSA